MIKMEIMWFRPEGKMLDSIKTEIKLKMAFMIKKETIRDLMLKGSLEDLMHKANLTPTEITTILGNTKDLLKLSKEDTMLL